MMKNKWILAVAAIALAVSVSLCFAVSPSSAKAAGPYYTVDAPIGTVDFEATGLLDGAKEYGTYSSVKYNEFYDAGAKGTKRDVKFTMSFFWVDDDGGDGEIKVAAAGWGNGPQVRFKKDGTVRVGYEKQDNKFVELQDKVPFEKDTVYRFEFTPYTLYGAETKQEEDRVGLRMEVHIYTDDESYDKTLSEDFTDLPDRNEVMGIDTSNLFIDYPSSVHNLCLASLSFDPDAERPEPTQYYTKEEIPTIDLAEVMGFNDPLRNTFDDTGEKSLLDKGVTMDKTLTLAFFWTGASETWPSIMIRTAGWAEDFQVRLSKDGTIKIGHCKNGDHFTEVQEKTAFTENTIYYLEYTAQYLYTDEQCSEIGGVRLTAYVHDKEKTYEKTVTQDYTPIPVGITHDKGNLIIFTNAEMTNQHLASAQYDPNAEKLEYEPAVDPEEIPVLDISDKMKMNADGLSGTSLLTKESDGRYGNYTGIYELNKTLRFAFEGKGSIHFALSGNFIWNSYKMDPDFTANKIKMDGKDVTPSEKLEEGKRYIVELTVLEYLVTTTHVKDHETFTAKMYYMDGDREVVVCNETLQFNGPPGVPEDGSRGYFGIYLGVSEETDDIHIYPVDFKRSYAVTIVNGDNVNQKALEYGKAYDLTEFETEKPMYRFVGWQYFEGGVAKTIPSTGNWTVDFTEQRDGQYVGTLTAAFEAIDYNITYHVEHGSNSADNPAKINAEDGALTLAAPTTDEGYVFFGWYTDAAFGGEPLETVSCTGAAIELYAKIREGVTLTLIMPDASERTVPVEKGATYTFPADTIPGYQAITGWKVRNGDNWTAVDGTSVSPTADATYRAVAAPIDYTVTYNTDGGTNSKDNPATFTVKSTVTFAPAEKEGYFFVGWFDDQGTEIRGIAPGTIGNLTVTARYVVDTLPETLSVAAGTTVSLPILGGLPNGSRYTVTVKDGSGADVTVLANTFTAAEGTYTATYRITLPAATYTREVTINAATPTIVLDGTLKSGYTVGEKLTLPAASANIDGVTVTVTVSKDGTEVSVADGELVLEQGTYTVTWTADGAEPITVTFTVSAAKKKGCGGALTPAGCGWICGGGSLLAVLCVLLSKKRRLSDK